MCHHTRMDAGLLSKLGVVLDNEPPYPRKRRIIERNWV